jgi:hypothetical protein
MNSKQTIAAIALLATVITGILVARGALPNVDLAAFGNTDVTAAGDNLEQRRTRIARLARDTDTAPELIQLLQDLQDDLQEQREIQQHLAAQLNNLRRESMAMAGITHDQGQIEPGATATTDASEASEVSAASAARAAQFWRRRTPVTEGRLVAAGFSNDQAQDIVRQVDSVAMDRLNLQYQAAREGWMDTEQYREARAGLPDVREVVTSQYGHDAYDRYLYASGRPNRLVVRDVLQNSPAGAAGLQPGDRVLAMADQRIYSTRDLINIASSGSEGESVPLVVERDDAVFELYVPRGPLGIRGDRGFQDPASP